MKCSISNLFNALRNRQLFHTLAMHERIRTNWTNWISKVHLLQILTLNKRNCSDRSYWIRKCHRFQLITVYKCTISNRSHRMSLRGRRDHCIRYLSCGRKPRQFHGAIIKRLKGISIHTAVIRLCYCNSISRCVLWLCRKCRQGHQP